jgi:ribosomal protein S12
MERVYKFVVRIEFYPPVEGLVSTEHTISAKGPVQALLKMAKVYLRNASRATRVEIRNPELIKKRDGT